MHLRVKVLVATIHDPAPEHRHAIALVHPGAAVWRNEALVGLETENTSDSQRACRQRQLLPVGAFDRLLVLPVYVAVADACSDAATVCCPGPRAPRAGIIVVGHAVQTIASRGEATTSIRGCQEGRVTLVWCDEKLPVGAEWMSERQILPGGCRFLDDGAREPDEPLVELAAKYGRPLEKWRPICQEPLAAADVPCPRWTEGLIDPADYIRRIAIVGFQDLRCGL